MPDRRRMSCLRSVRSPLICGSSELQRVGKYSFSYGPGDSFERWRQRQYLSQPDFNLLQQNLQFEACGHFNLATDRGAKTIGAARTQVTFLQSYSAWWSKTIRTVRAREYRSNKRPFRQVHRVSPGRHSAANCRFEVVSAVIGPGGSGAGQENSHTSA